MKELKEQYPYFITKDGYKDCLITSYAHTLAPNGKTIPNDILYEFLNGEGKSYQLVHLDEYMDEYDQYKMKALGRYLYDKTTTADYKSGCMYNPVEPKYEQVEAELENEIKGAK